MPAVPRPPLVHPPTDQLELTEVLSAFADPTRLTIVRTLLDDRGRERACGSFPVAVSASTLTHHFRVLRDAGVIRQREEANRRWTAIRQEDLDTRFPGLLAALTDARGPRASARLS